jgi:hypothetical protein
MVQEPSRVKLSPIHVCKIGLGAVQSHVRAWPAARKSVSYNREAAGWGGEGGGVVYVYV